jgi:hypothetical protein
MQEVTENTARFRQEHQPLNVDGNPLSSGTSSSQSAKSTAEQSSVASTSQASTLAGDEYKALANHFRQLNTNLDAGQYLASLHPNMSRAQLASHTATQEIKSSLGNKDA